MTKILTGGLIGLCLLMFNVSASYSQVPERSGCKSLEDAKRVALVFLQIPHDSELISSKVTLIH